MDDVLYDQPCPELRRPVFVAAFRGWSDAGDAASTAVEFLQESWDAKPFASIDAEEFFDFQVTRPHTRMSKDGERFIQWPQTEFMRAAVPGTDRDAVLLCGVEPSLQWKRFTNAVATVIRDTGAEMVVTLGALLADVPHTRPVNVTGSTNDPALAERLGLRASRYQGPTGIVGVLHDALKSSGVDAMSLWAATPQYVREAPSPKAALALVGRLAELIGADVDTADLQERTHKYEAAVDRAVAADTGVNDYVRRLEEAFDERREAENTSGEEIAEEFERYLRDLPRD